MIHEIKGENWELTSGWRSTFSTCLRFDPTDARSPRYNPLLEVRRGTQEVRDVQNIADILVDPEGSLERRNHWEKTAHALLVGVILHVLYAEGDKTLAGCAQFLSDPSRSLAATLTRMMGARQEIQRPLLTPGEVMQLSASDVNGDIKLGHRALEGLGQPLTRLITESRSANSHEDFPC